MTKCTILAVAAAAAAFTSTAAAAVPAAAAPEGTVVVAYQDLNLATASGRRALDNRIAFAARQMCGNYLLTELKFRAQSEACQADIVASAQMQRNAVLGGQRLAALTVSREAI